MSLDFVALNHLPPFFNQVTQRYGKVLSELPKETLRELKNFVQWAQAQPLRWSVLNNKVLSRAEHKILLTSFFESMFCQPETHQALNGLVALNRLTELPLILSYVDMALSKKTHLYMTHAHKLSSKVLAHLEQTLKEHLGQDIKIHFKSDPKLIEGYVIFAGHRMLDRSLLSFFSHLKQKVNHVLS